MKEKLVLTIQANCGYSIDQVAPKARMTVGELRNFLEGLDDDMPIVTNDENNSYGANWGIVTDWDTQGKETFLVDYIVKDKETGEEVFRYEDAEVYDCDSDEEQSELDHSFGIPEKYFDEDKYVMDWEEK